MKPNEARMVIRKCSLTPLSNLAGFIERPLWRTSSSRVGAKCCSTSSGSWRRGGALERLISTSGFLFFHLIRFSSRSTRCRQPGNRKWRQDSAKRRGEGGEATADKQEWRDPWDCGGEAVPHTFPPAAEVVKNARLHATVHRRSTSQTLNANIEGWEQWSGGFKLRGVAPRRVLWHWGHGATVNTVKLHPADGANFTTAHLENSKENTQANFYC